MLYYQSKCPECGKVINIHRSGKKLFLKNVCRCLQSYKDAEPLYLSSVRAMFDKQFRAEFNRDKTTTVVLR